MPSATRSISKRRKALVGLAGASLFAANSAAAVDFSSTALKSVFVRTNQVTATINESNLLAALPNASIGNFIVPASDTDLFTVQFSAQIELRNGSIAGATFNADDVVDLQAQAVNNVSGAVTILSPSGVTGFSAGNEPEAHSMTWAARLPTGSFTIRIMGRVLDRAPGAVVSALVSNWTMVITRYN
jgi:hypothetical protein